MSPELVIVLPLYLPGGSGSLFALYFAADRRVDGALGPALLHLPAFAEEMNKSRRMVAIQARACQKAGYSVLVVDLYGCGDSDGVLSDASWEGWLDDLARAISWLRDRGHTQVILWGLRSGALLASELAERCPVDALLWWQPLLQGGLFLTQFLRLRIASAALAGGSHENTRELRARIAEGELIEVAGYPLKEPLVAGLEAASLKAHPELPCHWLEIGDPNGGATPAQERVITAWGDRLQVQRIAGEPFWARQEIVELPSLIQATSNSLERLS